MLYFKRENHEKVVFLPIFKKSIDLNSEFYESYKSIGKCYYLLYDNSNSKKWFDLALKHCKNEKQTKEKEEWLKKF